MSPAFERVKEEVDQLPRREQFDLYEALRERFEPEPREVESEDEMEAAWDREIEKRVAEIESGEARMISAEEFFSVFEEIRAGRRNPAPAEGEHLELPTNRSVDADEIEAAWDSECARRVAEMESGEAELVSWEEVRKDLNALRAGRDRPAPGSWPDNA